MNNFRTEINPKPFKKKIEHDSDVIFIGSCFSENIGNKFKESRLPVLINPFGIIYNPMSVVNTLQAIITNKIYTENDLEYHNDLWLSFDHHSIFSDTSRVNCLQKINDKCHKSHNYLRNSQFIFITFGTAWVYQLKESNRLVSNCHKYPADSFNRYILNIDEIVNVYKKTLTELLVFNPNLNIIFTVSPVRHWKDGAHNNQLSKSTLLLAINQICELFESCHYFPAYELLMDDLRDYRFYTDDMLHPSNSAIEYIWSKFENCFFSSSTLDYKNEMLKLDKAIKHKPFNPASESHQQFLKKQITRIKDMMSKYPKADLSEDLAFLESRII